MIQRIQTVYLAVIVVICLLLCGMSVINMHQFVDGKNYDYSMNFMYYKVYENGVLVQKDLQYILLLLLSITIVWTVKIIFGYKNRTQQIKNARINFIFLGVQIIAILAMAYGRIPGFNFSSLSADSVVSLALMIFSFYLNVRVIMLIRMDDNLVKSADRIR